MTSSSPETHSPFTCLEVCAGAGGQSLGLEQAGFTHLALVESDPDCCATLRLNRPHWPVMEQDLKHFDGRPFAGRCDLLAGGVPCPPFSIAGKQLGNQDERDLFPDMLRLAGEIRPRAVFIENVRGILSRRFDGFRMAVYSRLHSLGYEVEWRLVQAPDFGVPQLRPRAILIGLRPETRWKFVWPPPGNAPAPGVGHVLRSLMSARGWPGAKEWADKARGIAPTIVGGSKKHGGPDLGPTRARAAWALLGVDGRGIARAAPGPDHVGMPRLTVQMAAVLQGFPPDWVFSGTHTAAYRQVGNAFPPPVARGLGFAIARALRLESGIEIPGEGNSWARETNSANTF
ncbi:MAG: Modification methylase AplI [Myxococcota bacterium]|nr:Modification methylase AplI [Myxococcota bacterium]